MKFLKSLLERPESEPKVRFVCISDTFDQLQNLIIPDGDVLIHAGNFTNYGSTVEFHSTKSILKKLPHKYKIIVPGNNDITQYDPFALYPNIIFLKYASTNVYGYNIYGGPSLSDDPIPINHDLIPSNIDIVISHRPPYGILDGKSQGEAYLLNQIQKVKPLYHVFGHVCESHGTLYKNGTTFINASICDENNIIRHESIVFDLPKKRDS